MKKQEASILKENKYHGTLSFRCCLYETSKEKPELDVKHHWHDEVELLYFKSGKYRLTVNMDDYVIDEECFCLLNSGELHAIKMLEPGEEYAILYHPTMISFEVYDAPQARLIQPLIQGELSLPRFIRISDLVFQPLRRAYEELVHDFEAYGQRREVGRDSCRENCLILKESSDQLMVKAGLLKLIALLNSYGMINGKVYESQKQVKVIKDAVNYIQENYQHKIYIKDLSELTGLNEQYFIRFFGNTLGKSPVEYINDYRVKKAQELLRTTEKAVTEVAAECGFHNMGNFIKIFKDISGTTPLRYRKSAVSD